MKNLVVKLNSPEYLPENAYRRNMAIYELVCYVNCLVGCRASGNKDGADLFKSRVEAFIDKTPPSPGFEKYFMLVRQYVRSSE